MLKKSFSNPSSIFLSMAVVSTSLSSLAVNAQEKQLKPNILTIIVDQHYGRVMSNEGCSWVKTPGMDKLARNGVKFTQAFTVFPLCTPARASMMTGQRPFRVYQNPTNYPSLANLVKKQNYQTAYYGKWHVGNKNMYDSEEWRGFDEYNGLKEIDSETAKATINYLDEYSKNAPPKPFFMIASFTNPHDVCESARKIGGWTIPKTINFDRGGYAAKLTVKDSLLPPLPFNFGKTDFLPSVMKAQEPTYGSNKLSIRPTGSWTPRDWRLLRYNYAKMVETVDKHIDKIIESLERNGLKNNTVVIFISDHGDGIGAHQFNQKHNFYNEAVNVPLIIVDPSGNKNVTSSQLSNASMDWFTTVLDYAGVDNKLLADKYEGMSLRDVVTNNGKLKRNYIVSEFIRDAQGLGLAFVKKDSAEYKRVNKYSNAIGRMVKTNDWKYIVYDQGEYTEALFKTMNDPGEMKNLAYNKKYKNKLQEMRNLLKEHIAKVGDNFKVPFK